MPTAFAQAFAKKATKVFDKAKDHKHREGSGYGPVDIPDGSYSAVVTTEAGVIKKGKNEGCPFVSFKACVSAGPHKGLEPSKLFVCKGESISDDPNAMPTGEQQLLALLSWLLPDIQIEDVSQVEQALDLVNERGPLCIIGVQNKELPETKDRKAMKVQNVYFNKMIEPATFEQSDDSSDPIQEETPTETPVDYVPAAKDKVYLTDEGDDIHYEVVAVSQSRQTANLKSVEDGAKRNGIPWSDLTQIDE